MTKIKTKKEGKKAITLNPMLPAVVLEPTMMFRIDGCRRTMDGGELQQLWVDKLTGKGQWKPIPKVYSGNYEYNGR